MCGKSSSNGSGTLAPVAVASQSDAIARFNAALDQRERAFGGPLGTMLRSEIEFIRPILDEIDRELTEALVAKSKAQAAKTAIQDTLLVEVLHNQALEKETSNQRGRIFELEMQLDAAQDSLAQMTENATEAERTIGALTEIKPETLVKAATVVRQTVRREIEQFKAAVPASVAERLDASLEVDPTYQDMREGTRQMIELSIAIERANDGVEAR